MHGGIDPGHARGSGFGLALAQLGRIAQRLAIQIGFFKAVAVHAGDRAHAHADQLLQQPTAQTAQAHQQHAALQQGLLVPQGKLPGVAGIARGPDSGAAGCLLGREQVHACRDGQLA